MYVFAASASGAMEGDVASVICNFAIRFCNELEKKNNVASPLSAETVLALLALGCKDKAHAELLQAFGMPDNDAIRSTFLTLKSVLNVKSVKLEVANKIYVKKGNYKIRADLKQEAEDVFGCDIDQINFDDKEAASGEINAWVSQETHGQIDSIISPNVFTYRSRLVLLNALYFKGTWSEKFDAKYTKEWTFFVNNQTHIKVQGMTMAEEAFNYGESEELQCKLLNMGFAGGEASMIVVLPHEIEGLDKLLGKLAAGYDLMTEIHKMWLERKMDIMIPKFKIETNIDLTTILPKLGIKNIFDEKTEDIKLLENFEDLFVSVGKQKAFVEVNEEGCEAFACSSGMHYVPFCKPREPERKNFIAWRPFLYLIMVQHNVMFMGTYRGKP